MLPEFLILIFCQLYVNLEITDMKLQRYMILIHFNQWHMTRIRFSTLYTMVTRHTRVCLYVPCRYLFKLQLQLLIHIVVLTEASPGHSYTV